MREPIDTMRSLLQIEELRRLLIKRAVAEGRFEDLTHEQAGSEAIAELRFERALDLSLQDGTLTIEDAVEMVEAEGDDWLRRGHLLLTLRGNDRAEND